MKLRNTLLRLMLAASATQFALSTCLANGAPYLATPTGGIVFKPNDQIRIVEETLRISWRRIDVVYEFENASPTPSILDIAFPLEAWSDNPATSGYEKPFEFQATGPDGKLKSKLRLVAWLIAPDGQARDVSSQLRRFNLLNRRFNSEEPRAAPLYHQFEKDCPSKGDKSGRAVCRIAMQEVATWRQSFPPGRSRIAISYRPSIGENTITTSVLSEKEYGFDQPYIITGVTSGGALKGRSADDLAADLSFRDRYCVDPATQAALKTKERAPGPSADQDAAPERLLDAVKTFPLTYVLDTGKYWNGPIGRFRLIVDKLDPRVLAAFCPASARKTSPTTFEWTAENFVPKGNLSVVFWLPADLADAEQARR